MINEQLVNELKRIGDALIKLADAMGTDMVPPQEAQVPAEEEKVPTFEEIRGAMALKIQEGHSDEIRGLLIKYGASKLSDIDATHYVAFMRDVEAI